MKSAFKSFYKKALPAKQRSARDRWAKRIVIFLKCVIMVVAPTPFVAGIGWFWFHFVFSDGWHFSGKMENIITTALFASQLINYGLLVTFLAYDPVCKEYKRMRFSVKTGDKHTFMMLRDESLSPLVHTLILVLSLFLLGTMMSIEYPTAPSGMVCVCSLSYLLILTFFVVIEIDNPCSGLWYIKDIPEEWLQEDVEVYRKKYCKSPHHLIETSE